MNFPTDTIKLIQYFLQNPIEVISYTIANPVKSLGYYAAFIWKVFSNQAWEFAANTTYIEIGYGETKNIHIGRVNMEILNVTHFKNISKQSFMESVSFKFLRDKYPGNFNESWTIQFNPDLLRMDTNNNKSVYDINVSISLTKPPVGEQAIQNGLLRIRQVPTQQYDSFWNMFTEADKKNIDLFILAFQYTRLFGKNVGGITSSPKYDNMRYVDILVKVKPYHKVSLLTKDYHTFSPNQVAAVPISVTNEGNYKDTIGFNIVSTNEKITLIDPIDITLKPGETKDTLLGVAVPPDFFEIGTLHEITIQAFSNEEPDTIIEEKIIVLQTEGFYLSEYFISIIGGIILLLVIIYLYFYSKRKKTIEKYYIKPEKPWDNPKEKEHLEIIKKKDKEKYKQTLQMMEEEYLSAMLWFKDHKFLIDKQLMKKKLEKQDKIKKDKEIVKEKKQKHYTKKEENIVKPKPKEEIKIKETKLEKIEKPAKPLKPEKKDKSTIEKEKAIQRIMHSQEKQRKKSGIKGAFD